MIVTSEELKEPLEHTIWNCHGMPHAGLGGLTSLEMMRHNVLGIGRPAVRLRILPATLREQPQLFHDPVSCQVPGQLARGERPYITYLHVRYTSAQLSGRPGLVGQTLNAHADPQELRGTPAQGGALQSRCAATPPGSGRCASTDMPWRFRCGATQSIACVLLMRGRACPRAPGMSRRTQCSTRSTSSSMAVGSFIATVSAFPAQCTFRLSARFFSSAYPLPAF